MAKDLVYAFDKNTFTSYELGEIQTDFNMSFVIDGTKDSAKMIVLNYIESEIEPYTIIFHEKTNTWWNVTHDKVERYQGEKIYNSITHEWEQTFIYVHNLELLGAIEFLNARDLTDCGFNDNTYDVNQFITRLFRLSNFEYTLVFSNTIDNDFLNKKVEFIKTFENYTLLSALREFLDAFNMCAKMYFTYTTSGSVYTISNAILDIVPKTGNYSNVHDISEFDDVKEIKTMDKNSFGVTVISNAENVTSSHSKTFPSTGSVRLSSTEYKIVDEDKLNNGVIRLPSKVFKGNWIKMLYRVLCYIKVQSGGSTWTDQLHYYASDHNSLDKLMDDTKDFVHDYLPAYDTAWSNFLTSNKAEIRRKLNALGTITIYNGNDVNPITGEIKKGPNVPYLTKFKHSNKSTPMVFVDKETRECLPDPLQGIAWERGSNIISGFKFLSSDGGFTTITVNAEDTDYQSNDNEIIKYTNGSVSISITLPQDNGVSYEQIKKTYLTEDLATQASRWSFIVNYNPMADLKIKVDNQRDKKDIQLYNQNGRVTDCVALSKLINSYSKEISSDTITRCMHYYSFNTIPKVGDIVLKDNIEYVINNVSMNFTQNETTLNSNFGYYIDCEFTMSKYIATKSLMVNPNTNIRDYGIPQNFNVKRKQVYRDYYELAYETYNDQSNNEYLNYTYIFAFHYETNDLVDLVAVMQIGYSSPIGGDSDNNIQSSQYWYYQLETTNYYLDKMICVVLDFQDNNIIGYGSQNVYSAFDVSRIFSGFTDKLNTPISYVDDKGEFVSIFIEFCTNEQITTIYNDYQDSQVGGDSFEGSLYNYSVFIPEDVFDAAALNNAMQIIEANYLKDALEVPVFEYICQIEDTKDVLIGDGILSQRQNCRYLYSYVIGGVGENLNPLNVSTSNTISYRSADNSYKVDNGCHITLIDLGFARMINIRFLSSVRVYPDNTKGFGSDIDMTQYEGRDVAVFRHSYDLDSGEQNVDLLFIAKKIPYDHIQNTSRVNLEINHYKLK